MKTLLEVKRQLIQAHKSGNWEVAKTLSQEKEKLKRQQRPRCGICNVPLARKPFGKVQPENCIMHHMMKRFYSVVLTCVVALVTLSIVASPQLPLLVFYWDYPSNYMAQAQNTNLINYNQVTNVIIRVYSTSDPTLPSSNWVVQAVAPLHLTNNFIIAIQATNDMGFYKFTYSNFWGETPFSGVLGTPAILVSPTNLVLTHQ